MTVESLLSEVKMVPHLAQQQRLKASDEAYFGGGSHGKKGQRHSESDGDLKAEVAALRKDNAQIHSELANLKSIVDQLQSQIAKLTGGEKVCAKPAAAPAEKPKAEEKNEDEDIDLFGSSDEEVDEEKERIKNERLKAYAEKKAKKPGPIAKSSVILDVKPWDDETDLAEMERLVRSIEKDGLVWGGGKLIPLAYGIKKLQIICVIEDDKVSVDDLIEGITEGFADHVQSVDISAFNKI
jgi:translation elongation factor EF-1beta